MLLYQIKQEQLKARKEGQKTRASSLTTLYSEAARIGFDDGKRDSTDVEVIAVIKKFIKNIDECLDKCSDEAKASFLEERVLLNEFLPHQLSEDELKSIIASLKLVDSKLDMKTAMSYLKSHYPGNYDGGLASRLIKQVIG